MSKIISILPFVFIFIGVFMVIYIMYTTIFEKRRKKMKNKEMNKLRETLSPYEFENTQKNAVNKRFSFMEYLYSGDYIKVIKDFKDYYGVTHQAGEELRCHYCEHHEPIPTICPKCNSQRIKFFGSGTQKVEEELRRHFKSARIARLDQDITKNKQLAEDILHDFGTHKYDILLGTQMVSKGHDFKDVTAVGILTADSVLNIPVYSASERTFDLLTQTSGRAGRGDKPGSVVIQTYNPLNYAIIKSKAHDYVGFYNEEIQNRKALGYPPFREMIHMVVRHQNMETLEAIANRIVSDLEVHKGDTDILINGPYEASIKKVRDMYRLAIMIRGTDLSNLKEYIYNSWIFTQEGLLIDVDPV